MPSPVPILIERIDRGASESMLASCHAIRRDVFVREQQISADLEWDHLDAESEHFLALISPRDGAEPTPIGTARFRVVSANEHIAKAERVAVLASARTGGVGRALMKALEIRAAELGLETIRLNAQVSVLRFYENLGYVAYGDLFEEAGIDHRAMAKRLAR